MALSTVIEKPITMVAGTDAQAADVNTDFDYYSAQMNATNAQVNTNTADIAGNASALVVSLAAKLDKTAVDTDVTLAANSDVKVASQKAVKTLVAATAFATALPGQTGNAGKFVTTDGTNASWAAVPDTRPFADNEVLAQIQAIALSI